MSAKLLRVSLGVGIGRLHTAIVARNRCLFFVSVARAVVLENAETRGLYVEIKTFPASITQNVIYHQG
jgi:hypothetical protein